MNRFRVAHISELHCGSVTGLTPPEEQTARNKAWLGPLWKMYVAASEQIGTVDALVLNGDLIDGPGRKDSVKHLTTDIVTQVDWATQAASVIKAKQRFVVRGTGYHTDHNGALEDIVAQSLNCDVFDELRLEIHGFLFHVRHHVGRSDTPYGQYTQNMKEAINEVLQAELEDYESADLLARGHVHYCTGAWRWNTLRGQRQEVFTNPAMQLRGPENSSYVRKLRTWMYHVGFTVVDFYKDEDRWEIRPFIFPIKLYAPQMRKYLCLT